jgi:hypothetical protein
MSRSTLTPKAVVALRARNKRDQRARRVRLAAAKLCRWCATPAKRGHVLCPTCLQNNADANKRYRDRTAKIE